MVAVIAFRITGKGWLDSLYFVVITLSSVGYGEASQFDAYEQVAVILLIVLGGSTLAYVAGGFLQMMIEGEVDRVLGRRRVTREIARLQGHVIICGYGRTGELVADEMARRRKPFVVLDVSQERVEVACAKGYPALTDNSMEEEALKLAGIDRAESMVTTLPSDAENVFLTLTARNLNPNLQIIARADFESTEKKLLQAGANRVVLPAATGALRMSLMLTRPSTLELLELVGGRLITDVEIDELRIPSDSPLVGVSVRDANIRAKFGLLIVGIQRSEGELIFNPDANLCFEATDAVIVMGHLGDIEKFSKENGLGRLERPSAVS